MNENHTPAIVCSCATHIDHSSMCDEDCECWGGVQAVEWGGLGSYVDVTYRVMVR